MFDKSTPEPAPFSDLETSDDNNKEELEGNNDGKLHDPTGQYASGKFPGYRSLSNWTELIPLQRMLVPTRLIKIILRLRVPLNHMGNLYASVLVDLAATSHRHSQFEAIMASTLLQVRLPLNSPTRAAAKSTTTFKTLLGDIKAGQVRRVRLLPALSAATTCLPITTAVSLVCALPLLYLETFESLGVTALLSAQLLYDTFLCSPCLLSDLVFFHCPCLNFHNFNFFHYPILPFHTVIYFNASSVYPQKQAVKSSLPFTF